MLAKYEQPALPIHIVYPTSRLLSAKVRAFVDLVVENGGVAVWVRSPSPSWPGLSRPSTFFDAESQNVDARDKPGHD